MKSVLFGPLMRHGRPAVAVALSGLLFAALAQAGEGSASVRGRVVDASGAGLPGITVTIEGSALSTPVSATTARDGSFELSAIPAPAQYRVACLLAGRAVASRRVSLEPGAHADLQLSVAPSFLDEVTVTASRDAQSLRESTSAVGLVERETLATLRPTHPGQALNLVSGVWVNTTGGEGHMTSIRQPLTTNPVYLYLEDGVPTRSTGFFNHNALYEIDVPVAEAVEVSKGPGSALYGSDAVGGVVNVLTRSALGPRGADVSVEGGGHGWRRALLGASTGGVRDAVRTDVNLSHTDGWRDATGYDRQSASLRWDRAHGAGWFAKTLVTYSHIDQQTAGTSTLPEASYLATPTLNLTPISFRKVEAFRASVDLRRDSGPVSWSVIPYFRYDSMDLLPNWTLTFDPTVYNTANNSYGLLAKARRDFAPWRTELVAGFDADLSPGSHFETQIRPATTRTPDRLTIFASFTDGPVIYDYAATFHALSPYVQASASPTRHLRLEAGLRFDHTGYRYDDHLTGPDSPRYRRPADATLSYDHLSPKLGLTCDLGARAALFASYRHAFRAPSEGQLFRQGSALDTIHLAPVKADQVEAGFRAAPSWRLSFEASAYRLVKRDDILTFRDPFDGASRAVNAGRTRHHGVEVAAKATPASWAAFRVSYTYARHTYVDWVVDPRQALVYSGHEIEVAPRHLGSALLRLGTRRASVTLDGQRVGAYWMDSANLARYGGHTLFNARAEWTLERRLTLFARLLNVTDARYAESTSYTVARGRELAPGLPRTAYLGVQVDATR